MAKAPMKKPTGKALMIVVMKKGNGGKKMKSGCEDDEGEEYRKGGMVRKPKRKSK
jgi:hypothetical protein